jgi:hypothetical protein
VTARRTLGFRLVMEVVSYQGLGEIDLPRPIIPQRATIVPINGLRPMAIGDVTLPHGTELQTCISIFGADRPRA